MGLFAPMDPRGPDQRRKLLMQKLARGRGSTPMPMQASHASMGGGTQFRGAGNFRPPSTHGSNVVSSILARLGVGGAPGQGEFSPGQGMAIGHGGGGGDPYSQTPQAITGGTPIAPMGGGDLPGGGGITAPPPGVGPPLGSGAPPGLPPWSPGGGLPNGAVPLGNGLFYDPDTDRIVSGTTDRGVTTNPSEGAHGLYRS